MIMMNKKHQIILLKNYLSIQESRNLPSIIKVNRVSEMTCIIYVKNSNFYIRSFKKRLVFIFVHYEVLK